MHFDDIQMINEATNEGEISHIFRYRSALFKIYLNTDRGIKIT